MEIPGKFSNKMRDPVSPMDYQTLGHSTRPHAIALPDHPELPFSRHQGSSHLTEVSFFSGFGPELEEFRLNKVKIVALNVQVGCRG